MNEAELSLANTALPVKRHPRFKDLTGHRYGRLNPLRACSLVGAVAQSCRWRQKLNLASAPAEA